MARVYCRIPRPDVLRRIDGIAGGGGWRVAAPVALGTLPAEARGAASKILQDGYATGSLFAAVELGLFVDRISRHELAATMQIPDGGADYGRALHMIMLRVFAAVSVPTATGPERRGISLDAERAA